MVRNLNNTSSFSCREHKSESCMGACCGHVSGYGNGGHSCGHCNCLSKKDFPFSLSKRQTACGVYPYYFYIYIFFFHVMAGGVQFEVRGASNHLVGCMSF